MTTILIILGILCLVLGIIFSIYPVIPGPPIAYSSLLLLQLTDKHPFSRDYLVILAVVVVVVLVLDYLVPIWGTKRFGGTKFGTWGSFFGIFAGLFMGPLGFIIGPFLGALAGELIGGKKMDLALKAAFGSFVGFMVTVVLKLGLCGYIIFYFIKTVTAF